MRLLAAALALLWLLPTSAQAQEADRAVLDACGEAEPALSRAAAEVARRRLRGQKVASPEELGAIVREAGGTAAWPRSLVMSGQPVDRAAAAARAREMARKLPARMPVRCGVASAASEQGVEVLAVVAAPAAAAVAPGPRRVRPGTWFTVDARMRVPASGARVVVLGPRGLPRGVPSSFFKGRVQARFSVDQPGRWLAQVVADLDAGPLPVAEIEVLGGDGEASAEAAAPGESASGASAEATLLAMVNEARRSEGLAALQPDPALGALARAHAAAMASKQLIGHDVGDGDPEKRLADAQITPRALGENVAHSRSLAQAHRALWSSPSHRQNLLSARFRRGGVGVARDADGSVWVAELFVDP